jgi:aspartate racemase
MSWESTLVYYRAINEGVKERLGALHSAKICLYSVDFAEIEKHQQSGNWETAASILSDGARRVEGGGADFLVICTNTMHKLAPQIEKQIGIPILHIADATAERTRGLGMSTVGLLGTRFTMEQDFYRGRLTGKYGLNVVTPEKEERETVHRVIYEELCLGRILSNSKEGYLRIIDRLLGSGAEAVILGCTEIGLLVKQEDTSATLLDTTLIHAEQAVELALS